MICYAKRPLLHNCHEETRFLTGFSRRPLGLGSKGTNREINAFAENLSDEEYFVYNDNDIAATLGRRRTLGLNLKARF